MFPAHNFGVKKEGDEWNESVLQMLAAEGRFFGLKRERKDAISRVMELDKLLCK